MADVKVKRQLAGCRVHVAAGARAARVVAARVRGAGRDMRARTKQPFAHCYLGASHPSPFHFSSRAEQIVCFLSDFRCAGRARGARGGARGAAPGGAFFSAPPSARLHIARRRVAPPAPSRHLREPSPSSPLLSTPHVFICKEMIVRRYVTKYTPYQYCDKAAGCSGYSGTNCPTTKTRTRNQSRHYLFSIVSDLGVCGTAVVSISITQVF